MRIVSVALLAHLQQATTTLAWCWKITRTDGQVYGYTTHDVDIVVGGVNYRSDIGFLPTTMDTSNEMSVSNINALTFLADDEILRGDVLAGVFDNATLDIFIVNYESTGDGVIYLARGWLLGQAEIEELDITFEVRSLTQFLQQTVVELYGPSCAARFGDERCKANVASYTVTGTVTSVTDVRNFVDSGRGEEADTFMYGKLTWTSGANTGRSVEITNFSSGSFRLFEAPPNSIQVGDTYSAIQGCDGRLMTCVYKFNNLVNFRGFPTIPQKEMAYDYAIAPTGG